MNTKQKVLAFIVLMLGLLAISSGLKAQNVKLEGKTFVQQATVGDSTATGYYYQDRQGNKYPIFLSSRGKAYCWVKSKKTGKMYRKYLPKITAELNKENNNK